MPDGIVLLWFMLAAMSVAFFAIDIRSTLASPRVEVGFHTSDRLYLSLRRVLVRPGCREPLE